MKTYRVRAFGLASTLALLFGLGLWASAVEAWDTCGSSTFPATGQTTSFASSTMTKDSDSPVRDDGAVRAGGALSYQNNGDGTITDLNTGLMWEQKIGDGGLHDVSMTFPWSSMVMETIWDWLDAVNAEGGTGLAGFNDWRIPNVKELQSIVDYGASSAPRVDVAFNFNNNSAFCTVTECSLTASGLYWSSTTHPNPAFAWDVWFAFGDVNGSLKSSTFSVRAVRDGCLP